MSLQHFKEKSLIVHNVIKLAYITNVFFIQQRSKTFSNPSGVSRDSITSPISASTQKMEGRNHSPNMLIHDSICEENSPEVDLEEWQQISLCDCLNFQVENCPDENDERPVDQNCNPVIYIVEAFYT